MNSKEKSTRTIEERVVRLERELAFLKAQGLSREEQDSLLGAESTSGQGRVRSGAFWWRVVQPVVLFLVVAHLLWDFWQGEGRPNSSSVTVEDGLEIRQGSETFHASPSRSFDHDSESEPEPLRGQPFALPR